MSARHAVSRGVGGFSVVVWSLWLDHVGAQRRRYTSGTDAGQFFVVLHVHNLELFGVHAGVGAE